MDTGVVTLHSIAEHTLLANSAVEAAVAVGRAAGAVQRISKHAGRALGHTERLVTQVVGVEVATAQSLEKYKVSSKNIVSALRSHLEGIWRVEADREVEGAAIAHLDGADSYNSSSFVPGWCVGADKSSRIERRPSRSAECTSGVGCKVGLVVGVGVEDEEKDINNLYHDYGG